MFDFQLNPKSGVPTYRQIQDQIRFGIASGLLTPGEQLPTVRELAVRLEVHPNTVMKAYTELDRAGVLSAEEGSGTYVASAGKVVRATADRRAALECLCEQFLAAAQEQGFTAAEVLRTAGALMQRSP